MAHRPTSWRVIMAACHRVQHELTSAAAAPNLPSAAAVTINAITPKRRRTRTWAHAMAVLKAAELGTETVLADPTVPPEARTRLEAVIDIVQAVMLEHISVAEAQPLDSGASDTENITSLTMVIDAEMRELLLELQRAFGVDTSAEAVRQAIALAQVAALSADADGMVSIGTPGAAPLTLSLRATPVPAPEAAAAQSPPTPAERLCAPRSAGAALL